jgi:hypothetical protein
MKKLFILFLAVLTILAGCQKEAEKTKTTISKVNAGEKKETHVSSLKTSFAHPQLLADKAGLYSLLTVGTTAGSSIETNETISESVKDILSIPTVQMAQKAYPDLHIEKDPSYLLFDQKGIVLLTNNETELSTYIKQHQ